MKRLITAEVIRQEHSAGKTAIEVELPDCIVTPEARLIAEKLRVTIHETVQGSGHRVKGQPILSNQPAHGLSTSDLAKVRAEVIARLPAGVSVPETVITQLVTKIANEKPSVTSNKAAKTSGKADFSAQVIAKGIKRVANDSIKFGLFAGAGQDKQVGIVDVITAEDGSSIAAGFMRWEKCFFPWTLTYDEIDYVISGELHIRCNGETVIGKAGDVIFIPKGSSIEFGTTSQVHFIYVAYPANWQDT